MNSRKNSFKRVAASALAVLTVAAYAAPVANVGGLPANLLVAEAASTSMVKFGNASAYITSATDGTTSISAKDIVNAEQYRFENGKVLTIVSSIPLAFPGGYSLGDTATDLTLDENANKYIETVSTDKNTFTYKVKVVDGIVLSGVNTSVEFNNATTTNQLQLADLSYVETQKVTADVFLNNSNTKLFADGTKVNADVIKKGNAVLSSTESFEAFVKLSDTGKFSRVPSQYNNGVYEASVKIDTLDANGVVIYVSHVDPSFTFTKEGSKLIANGESANKVEAASITATYKSRIRNTDPDTRANTPYIYDQTAELASGSKISFASRVELTFKNDSAFTSCQDATHNTSYYTLSIKRNGTELTKDDDVEVGTELYGAVGANAQGVTAAPTADKVGTPVPMNDPVAKKYTAVNATLEKHVPVAQGTADAKTAKLSFTETGKYVVTYTVYTKTVTKTTTNGVVTTSTTYTPQVLTYEFEIAPKSDLTADCVRLNAYDNAALNSTEKLISKTKVGSPSGVVEFEVKDGWNGETIYIDPKIFEDSADAADPTNHATSTFNAGTGANGTPISVDGTTSINVLNQVQTMVVKYKNAQYGGTVKSITIKWKLVSEKHDATIVKNPAYNKNWETRSDANNPYVISTLDNLDKLEENIFDAILVKNGSRENVSFEYMKGYGKNMANQELDWHETGLPKELGEYSVFVLYDDVAVETFNLKIDQHALLAAPTEDQLTMTYGDDLFETEDLAFTDINGKEISDADVKKANITVYQAVELPSYMYKKITGENKVAITAGQVDGITVAGTYDVYTSGDKKFVKKATAVGEGGALVYAPGVKTANYYDAGAYIVNVNAGANTTQKAGYSVQPSESVLIINKKAITADMVLIYPATYADGTTVTPFVSDDETAAAGKIIVKDTAIKDGAVIPVTISGKTTSESKVGIYDIKLTVGNTKNYTGSVIAKWAIVENGTYIPGLKFTDNTKLLDNGKINVEVERPDTTQFSNGVAQYGVVYEKNGKLTGISDDYRGKVKFNAAGTAYEAATTLAAGETAATADTVKAYNAALKSLTIGNGSEPGKQGTQQAGQNGGKIYSTNLNVVEVDTGVWLRPYVIDGKGNIYYGGVKYVNLVNEATEQLNLKIANNTNNPLNTTANSGKTTIVHTRDEQIKDRSTKELTEKTWRSDVQSGYNTQNGKYYVYGSYTIAKGSEIKESSVQTFGVVVDKTGAFGVDGKSVADATVDVKDGLVLGKGFIEGKGGSNKLDKDEYHANITPANTVTGVWVRAYVNLGKGKFTNKELIVYTDPIYITDVSNYYSALKPTVTINDQTGAINYDVIDRKKLTVTTKPGNGTTQTVKNAGVIVDKSGAFLDKVAAGENKGDYVDAFTVDGQKLAGKSLLIGNGYLQGRGSVSENIYSANVTPNSYNKAKNEALAGIPLVVRPFTTYVINNVEVVVYGDVTVAGLV